MNTSKVRVEVRNGDINRALKQLKRKSMDSGHLDEYKERQEYKKPKTIRREQKQEAIRANNRRLWNETLEN